MYSALMCRVFWNSTETHKNDGLFVFLFRKKIILQMLLPH